MRCVEETGKNVEEAVNKALQQLGIEKEESTVEVLDEGAGGIFRRSVKVRVSYVSNGILVKQVLVNLMGRMGVESQVSVKEDDEGIFHCDLRTKGLDGLFIGKGGKTLEALQHVLTRIVNREIPQTRVSLDIGGYKERYHDQLRKHALELAQKVRDSNEEVMMDPLRASDRKVIHIALQDDPEVRTYTVGDGDERSVILAPRVIPFNK